MRMLSGKNPKIYIVQQKVGHQAVQSVTAARTRGRSCHFRLEPILRNDRCEQAETGRGVPVQERR